eukprot:g34881.t1
MSRKGSKEYGPNTVKVDQISLGNLVDTDQFSRRTCFWAVYRYDTKIHAAAVNGFLRNLPPIKMAFAYASRQPFPPIKMAAATRAYHGLMPTTVFRLLQTRELPNSGGEVATEMSFLNHCSSQIEDAPTMLS